MCGSVRCRVASSGTFTHASASAYGRAMRRLLRLVRFVLLVVLTFLTLSLVIAIARPEIGAAEKVVLAAAVIGLLGLAVPVRRLGEPTSR